MFTSRAEYRLLLREDNADSRLCEIGHRIGLLPDERYRAYQKKQAEIDHAMHLLERVFIRPSAAVDGALLRIGSSGLKQRVALADLLRRPEISMASLAALVDDEQRPEVEALGRSSFSEEIQLRVKYSGYIDRQNDQVSRFRKLESTRLPEDLDYSTLSGLSNEVVEKLSTVKPLSLGQASRISGVTPAAISILQVHLRKLKLQNRQPTPVNAGQKD